MLNVLPFQMMKTVFASVVRYNNAMHMGSNAFGTVFCHQINAYFIWEVTFLLQFSVTPTQCVVVQFSVTPAQCVLYVGSNVFASVFRLCSTD